MMINCITSNYNERQTAKGSHRILSTQGKMKGNHSYACCQLAAEKDGE